MAPTRQNSPPDRKLPLVIPLYCVILSYGANTPEFPTRHLVIPLSCGVYRYSGWVSQISVEKKPSPRRAASARKRNGFFGCRPRGSEVCSRKNRFFFVRMRRGEGLGFPAGRDFCWDFLFSRRPVFTEKRTEFPLQNLLAAPHPTPAPHPTHPPKSPERFWAVGGVRCGCGVRCGEEILKREFRPFF